MKINGRIFWPLMFSLLAVIGLAVCSGSAESGSESKPIANSDSTLAKPAKTLPLMLELGSTNCKPCKMMAPIVDSLEVVYKDKAELRFINVKEDRGAAAQYKVVMIPTQVFFDSLGQEVYRHVGFFPADSITAHFKQMGIK